MGCDGSGCRLIAFLGSLCGVRDTLSVPDTNLRLPFPAVKVSRRHPGITRALECEFALDSMSGTSDTLVNMAMTTPGMTAKEFRAARKAAGLSQQAASVLLRVTTRTIERWERGHTQIDDLRGETIRRRFSSYISANSGLGEKPAARQ